MFKLYLFIIYTYIHITSICFSCPKAKGTTLVYLISLNLSTRPLLGQLFMFGASEV